MGQLTISLTSHPASASLIPLPSMVSQTMESPSRIPPHQPTASLIAPDLRV